MKCSSHHFIGRNIYGDKFIEQELMYMHENLCRGVWSLAMQPMDYVHSSAKYYAMGEQGIYEVKNYALMVDVDLTKGRDKRRARGETLRIIKVLREK
ncbi:MAG: hypothetical protein ACKOC0_14130 [Cytophagales bacterium]